MAHTDVVFLRDNLCGDIFAVFPGIAATVGKPHNMTCYAHTGQHSAASLEYCAECAEVTDPTDYADLAAELMSGGYNLRVVRKYWLDGADYAAERRRQLER